jgi:CubicO group peptidase (beta-lactamase class C family)
MKRNYYFLAILCLVLCLTTLPVYSQENKTNENFAPEEIKKFVNEQMKIWKDPGVAIAIIKDDKIIFSEGFGYSDIKKQQKVTPKTLFAIGSATKAFTATAVSMLVDERKLDLDTPIRNYYPDLQLKDQYTRRRES